MCYMSKKKQILLIMGSSIAQNVNYGSVLNMLAQEENNVQTVSHIH